MINTKLILIEGMAGSGKSTTGQKLFDIFSENKIESKFYHEFSKDHPIIDYSEINKDIWLSETITRWKLFVDKIVAENIVYIMDAAFFQCTIGEMLERGFSETEIINHALKIIEIVKPANPALIYYYQDDIKSTLKKVYDSRNEKWQNKVKTFLNNTPFGNVNSATGYELYLQFNIVFRRMTDDIFNKTEIKKLAIENTNPNWPKLYQNISNFLQM